MKNSLGMFHAAKGLLMIGIILSHSLLAILYTLFPYDLLSYNLGRLAILLVDILSYAVIPLFFAICGYGFRRRKLRFLIKSMLTGVLKVYCITSLFVIAFRTLTEYLSGGNAILTLLTGSAAHLFALQPHVTIHGIDFGDNGPLWFIWTFMGSSVMLNQILLLKKRRHQVTVCVLSACAGLFLMRYYLPFCLQKIFICTSYMYLGWFMGQEKLLEKKPPRYLGPAVFLFVLALALRSRYYISISDNIYYNGVFDLIATWLVGYILMFPAADLGAYSGRLAPFLCWVGQNVFYICCFHTVEYKALPLLDLAGLVFGDGPCCYIAFFLVRILWAFGLVYVFTRYRQERRIRKYLSREPHKIIEGEQEWNSQQL
jgi:fucose 4-O-acetylase-like acetyltransferase